MKKVITFTTMAKNRNKLALQEIVFIFKSKILIRTKIMLEIRKADLKKFLSLYKYQVGTKILSLFHENIKSKREQNFRSNLIVKAFSYQITNNFAFRLKTMSN